MLNSKIYTYKGKLYEIESYTKTKINGVWVDSVIYRCLYLNPDGQLWVRTKEEFDSLFWPVIKN